MPEVLLPSAIALYENDYKPLRKRKTLRQKIMVIFYLPQSAVEVSERFTSRFAIALFATNGIDSDNWFCGTTPNADTLEKQALRNVAFTKDVREKIILIEL